MDVDVEIDEVDAALPEIVSITFMPRSMVQRGALDLREIEAFPFPAGRETFAAAAGELIGEDALLAALVAEHDGTELAHEALIDASHRLLVEDGLAKEAVCVARHGPQKPPKRRLKPPRTTSD